MLIRNNRLLSLLCILVFLVLVTVVNFSGQKKMEQKRECSLKSTELSRDLAASLSGKLEAHAVAVYDLSNGKTIYTENGDLSLPLASLTKLMTVRVALKTVQENTRYTVKKSDVIYDGGSGFVQEDVYSVHDLLLGALVASSNNAAVMLAKSTGLSTDNFTSLMNFEAQNLGLASLKYNSVSGLDTDDLEPTATGSANDVVRLLYRDLLDMPNVITLGIQPKATIRSESGRTIELVNTNTALSQLPLLKASKTGYTISAGGNLAVIWQEPGGDLLGAAVLGSSLNGRFSDMTTLHTASNQYVQILRSLPSYCN